MYLKTKLRNKKGVLSSILFPTPFSIMIFPLYPLLKVKIWETNLPEYGFCVTYTSGLPASSQACRKCIWLKDLINY